MTRRLVCGIALILLLAAIGVFSLVVFPDPEKYEGKPLAFWISEADFNQPADRREAARKALRAIGPRIIPQLLRDLEARESVLERTRRWLAQKQTFIKIPVRSVDERMRQAVWAFDALGTNAVTAIPGIVNLLDRGPGYAPGALVAISDPAVPAMRAALAHTNQYVRSNLGGSLANALEAGRISREATRSLVPVLIGNLTHSNSSVRWNAACALGSIHLEPPLCIPELIKGLTDPDLEVQSQCARALTRFGDEAAEALPAILQLYQGARADRRQTLCNSVRYFRSAPKLVVPFLVRALSDVDPMVRMFAASSLGQLSQLPELAIPALTNAVQDPHEFVRMNAVKAIGNYVENSDVPGTLSEKESLTRQSALSGTCVAPLITALGDSHDMVRLSAATSLGKFQASGSNAIPALIQALNDSVSSVRGNSTNALRRISPPALRSLR